MANGISNRNPWELDYGQISGAQGGGQNLQDIVQYLFDRTRDAGWFGTDYTEDLKLHGSVPVEGNLPMEEGQFITGGFQQGPSLQMPSGYTGDYIPMGMNEWVDTERYTLDNLINMLTDESSSWMQELTDDERQGYGALGSMLQDINLGGLTREFKQNVGDISSEISGQIQGLQKGYGTGQKTSRYGKIGSGGRNLGDFSRKKYIADIYGLQQKQQELTRGAQGGLEEDFYGKVGSWMSLNQPPID